MWAPTVDDIVFIFAAGFQLAAIAFAFKMIREARDRRPWVVLSAALLLMFLVRCVYLMGYTQLGHLQPPIAVVLSVLLFIALFYIRTISVAEREIENRYRALVELSPDAIFVNANNEIVYINPAALKFFGASKPEELLGRSPMEFVSAASAEVIRTRIRSLTSDGTSMPLVEEEWVRLDGSRVTVEAVAAGIPWQRGKAIQVVLRDISDRKKADSEKARLLSSERAARNNAEHANRMKDEFLATLSHELRTPLNAILGWSQLLRGGESDAEELKQGLDTIERNARAQTQLIEDLLDMSRIISGNLRLDIQRVVPVTFITNAIESIKPAAEAKEIRLEQILDPAAGPVSGDPNRLQQVAWNLLSNAVKFTPRGGKVQILLQRVDSHVEFTVSDTGQGISPEFLPFLFERFRQADASTTRQFGGLGLGLSIAKQLVDLHGGSIRARSAGAKQGSTFVVKLPLVAVYTPDGDSGHFPAQDSSFDVKSETDLADLTVLVVDDEADTRELIKRILENNGANVITASSAADGLLKVNSADVLISDIGMPDTDGYEFLRLVRAMGNNRSGKIPAIALTAFARSEDRTRAMMSGYQVHLSKPVSAAELIAATANVTGRTGENAVRPAT